MRKVIGPVCSVVAVFGSLGLECGGLFDTYLRDVPERVYGLESRIPANAELKSVSIPTRNNLSDVVVVEAFSEQQYKLTEDGTVLSVDGLFGYCIKSSDGFAVRPDPETMRYDPASNLCDQERGKVVYETKQLEQMTKRSF